MSEILQYLTQRIDAARASGDIPYAMALMADLERYERRAAIAANEAAEAKGVRQFGIQIEVTGWQIAELGQLIQAERDARWLRPWRVMFLTRSRDSQPGDGGRFSNAGSR